MPRPRKVERKKPGPKPKSSFNFQIQGYVDASSINQLLEVLVKAEVLKDLHITTVTVNAWVEGGGT